MSNLLNNSWEADDPWGMSIAVGNSMYSYLKPIKATKRINDYTVEYSIVLEENEANCLLNSISLVKDFITIY
jgi:hypothetical protein